MKPAAIRGGMGLDERLRRLLRLVQRALDGVVAVAVLRFEGPVGEGPHELVLVHFEELRSNFYYALRRNANV